MDMSNVISTGQDGLFQGRLDRKQAVGMVAFVAEKAKAMNDQLTLEMRNELKTLTDKLAVIDRKAEVFDKPEVEALEAAFQSFLNTSGVSTLLGAMSVSINGVNYSVSSVLDTLVGMDKILSKEILAVDNDELPTSVKFVLQDGYEVIMVYARVDDADTATTTITGTAGDWRGLPATDVIEFTRFSRTIPLMGEQYLDVRYNLKRTTNIMFDLTPMLDVAAPILSAAPDLNGDGVIGTPA